MSSMKKATGGAVISTYMVIRSIAAAFNVRLGGHIQFIRPLVLPMSQAAAEKSVNGKLDETQEEALKGINGAVENFGNFFAQNVFAFSAGVLLMQGTLAENGFDVNNASIAIASIPIMIITIIFTIIQAYLFDKKLKKGGKQS